MGFLYLPKRAGPNLHLIRACPRPYVPRAEVYRVIREAAMPDRWILGAQLKAGKRV
jgi:hypothetical protein